MNPLISHQAKKTNLRKVKTDIADAYQLGELFYKEELEPCKKRGQFMMNSSTKKELPPSKLLNSRVPLVE